VVIFTPRPFYPWGKRPRYPLDRMLGGPQFRSVHCGEEKNSCHCRESNPCRPPHSLVTLQFLTVAQTRSKLLWSISVITLLSTKWLRKQRCYTLPCRPCSLKKVWYDSALSPVAETDDRLFSRTKTEAVL
jgi:hypothetical protein